MNDEGCSRLAVEHPEVPAVIVHDSILTKPGHVGLVRRLIAEQFAGLGVAPALTTEDYANEPQ